jgi:hypothetical protein
LALGVRLTRKLFEFLALRCHLRALQHEFFTLRAVGEDDPDER